MRAERWIMAAAGGADKRRAEIVRDWKRRRAGKEPREVKSAIAVTARRDTPVSPAS